MQRIRLISLSVIPCLALAISLPACNGDDAADEMSEETSGDGDGDPGDGDGDSGDGDGDPGDGDGDPGDGDGDPGDGDGDPGDGDGDPGDGDGDPGDGDGDPGGLSFETDVYPILQASCSCHVGGAPSGLAMPNAGAAYDNLVSVASSQDPNINRIEPGDPDNSYLYQKITAAQAGLSPQNAQMPKTAGQAMSADPLSAADQQTIADWITDGAAP